MTEKLWGPLIQR